MDGRAHNTSTTFAIPQYCIPTLKKNLKYPTYSLYLTDSPMSQHSNVFIMTMLLKCESMFHITVDWLFFVASQKIGPCDGHGDVSKRCAEE